jgi:hypothetical protein
MEISKVKSISYVLLLNCFATSTTGCFAAAISRVPALPGAALLYIFYV